MKTLFKKAIIVISLTFLIPLLGRSQSWSILGSGANALKANGAILSLTADPAGNVYAGGNFRNNAGYPYVAKWNGTTWTELQGTNSFQPGYIESLASDPNGNIYAGGPYSNGIGGFLAKWNGTNWTNLNGLFNSPYNSFLTITSDNVGNVYTAVYDTTNVNSMYVVKWDGNIWSTLSAFPTNVYISSVVADGNGNVYASAVDSNSYSYVTKWNGSNWSTLGASPNLISSSQIFCLHIDNSNNLYARAGQLVAKWINNDWIKLGTGSTPLDGGAGPQVCSDLEGNIYTTAPFLTSNSYKVQKWDGSSWYPAGLVNGADYTFNGSLSPIVSDQLGNIYTGGYATDTLGYFYVAKYTQPHNSPIRTVDKLNQSLNMYPNPSSDDIFIQLENDHPSLKILIFNILGQIVQSFNVPRNGLKSPFKINVDQLINSQYILQITGDNVNLSRRFIKG